MGVIVLAGPSGSGKSHLAQQLGWPTIRLDDLYRNFDDPDMPQSSLGLIDWDDARSWDRTRALETIVQLHESGSADVPVYDIAQSKRVSTTTITLSGPHFIVEGLFATDLIDDCRRGGILVAAICVRHHRFVTFLLRLRRDLREGRKSPWVLLRRGWRLMRAEPTIIAEAVERGCVPMTPSQAVTSLKTLGPCTPP